VRLEVLGATVGREIAAQALAAGGAVMVLARAQPDYRRSG
jgi:hypothetical protein